MNEGWYLLDSQEKEISSFFPNGILDKQNIFILGAVLKSS